MGVKQQAGQAQVIAKDGWSLALLEVLMQLTGNECYALTSLGESLFSEQ